MSAIEPLSQLIGINAMKLSKEENILLEIQIFSRICEELKEIFRDQYKDYFYLMKFDREMENIMLESKFMRFLIHDILLTNEYNLEGISIYTQTPEDVLYEFYIELNTQPSASLLRKIIELHRTVRRDLYLQLTKKIASEYLSVA